MMRTILHWLAGFLPLRVIEAEDDALLTRMRGFKPLFERYFLCAIPRWIPRWCGGAIYLHHYLRSDPDRGLHDHPWDRAFAWQLAGGYSEERLDGFSASGMRKIVRRRPAGWFYFLRGSDFHRVIVEGSDTASLGAVSDPGPKKGSVTEGCNRPRTSWSLFAHGPYSKGWGFLRGMALERRLVEFVEVHEESSGRNKWWLTAPRGRDQERATP